MSKFNVGHYVRTPYNDKVIIGKITNVFKSSIEIEHEYLLVPGKDIKIAPNLGSILEIKDCFMYYFKGSRNVKTGCVATAITLKNLKHDTASGLVVITHILPHENIEWQELK